ncbi:MAG: hypothetical protein HC935_07555 [Pseudanabaena sp. SU_2_4]|nr:hypothetical protein [Pseudanabaena sp. SU_2_4]
MFILNRRDVEITSISHPSNQDKKISILLYRDQTFRLMQIFGNDREQALLFWRDLVDNKGMNCILLEEPESSRFSVWGKFIFDKNLVKPIAQQNLAVRPAVQPASTLPNPNQPPSTQSASSQPDANKTYFRQIDISLVKACLLVLQTIYLEIEDLFGARQARLFKQDILTILLKGQFPQVDGMDKLEQLLSAKDLANIPLPYWDDRQMQILLKELYQISKSHFGNTLFLNAARGAIEEMPSDELTKFQTWLSKSPHGQFWQ